MFLLVLVQNLKVLGVPVGQPALAPHVAAVERVNVDDDAAVDGDGHFFALAVPRDGCAVIAVENVGELTRETCGGVASDARMQTVNLRLVVVPGQLLENLAPLHQLLNNRVLVLMVRQWKGVQACDLLGANKLRHINAFSVAAKILAAVVDAFGSQLEELATLIRHVFCLLQLKG